MKILITGSSGMLGTDLVEVLSPHFQVYGLSRHSTKATGFTPIQLDLTDCEKLREKILDIKPDLVIHAAAFTRVDDCESQKELAEKQNTEVVRKIIDICNEVNAFLIFFSTDYVFSGQKQEPYLENDPVEPQSVYGRTKAWAEAALKEKSKRFMIFRVTWLYGENGRHFPGAILKQALEKKVIPVVADQKGRPTWTKDLALALRGLLLTRFEALNQYNKQIFHLGNSGIATWAEFARKILDLKHFQDVSVKPISAQELGRPAPRPANSVLNLEKAEKYLGIKLRSWQEALDEFLRTMKV